MVATKDALEPKELTEARTPRAISYLVSKMSQIFTS